MTTAQNKANFEKWLTALRSGEFAQTDGRLMDVESDSYCCLGVACEVMNAPKDQLETGKDLYGNQFFDWFGIYPMGMKSEPRVLVTRETYIENTPEVFRDLPWFDSYIGATEEGAFIAVTSLNDICGWNFDQIADALEATYMSAFKEAGV